MPKIGDYQVILADIGNAVGPGHRELPRALHGRVTYVNRAHRWYLVEAVIDDNCTIREGFKF